MKKVAKDLLNGQKIKVVNAAKFDAAKEKVELSVFGTASEHAQLRGLSKLAKEKLISQSGGMVFADLADASVALVVNTKKSKRDAADIRKNAANIARRVAKSKFSRIAIYADTLLAGGALGGAELQALVEGLNLGQYEFAIKKKPREGAGKTFYLVCELGKSNAAEFDSFATRGEVNSYSTLRARELVNLPPNLLTPAAVAAEAEQVAGQSAKLSVKIFSDINKAPLKSMGAYVGVGLGSQNEPRFIHISYNGAGAKSDTHLYLVGKTITFDSGGLSLKPAGAMRGMKADMGGGASVLAAIEGIARLGLKLNVSAVLPATENMPSGSAQRPDDIVTAMDGHTIEIANTDAEGRLALADAVLYAIENGATHIVDVATLTGAIRIALGYGYSGAYTNNDALLKRVVSAGKASGELVWPMPLDDYIRDDIKSPVADIKNVGNPNGYAGAGAGAGFIEFFVGKTPWVHLDIAGASMSAKSKGELSMGATGVMARTLIQLADDMQAK